MPERCGTNHEIERNFEQSELRHANNPQPNSRVDAKSNEHEYPASRASPNNEAMRFRNNETKSI